MVIDHVISKKKQKDIIKTTPITLLSEASKLLAENAPIEMLMKALAQAKESVWGCAVNVESGFV